MRKALLLTIILMSSCESYDYRLKFISCSDTIIYFSISNTNNFLKTNYLNKPEASLSSLDNVYKLKANDSLRIRNYGANSWENYVGSRPNDSLYIFTFKYQDLVSNNWEEIYKENLYKSKIKFSLSELKRNKWIIKFPSSCKY